MWDEHRQLFKSAVGHSLMFLMILLVLNIADYVVKRSNFTQERKDHLEKIDFYLWSIVLILLGFGLIYQVVVYLLFEHLHRLKEWRNEREKHSTN